MYVLRYPIRSAGMICDNATSKKYMLKKNLNSLKSVRGRKDHGVYLAFETPFGGKRVGCFWPTDIDRVAEGSCSSSGSSSPVDGNAIDVDRLAKGT